MSRLATRAATCVSLLCAIQVGQPQPRSQPKRSAVQRYRFSVERPTGWLAGIDKDDGFPVFVNFPWSKMQAQLTLPAGGAVIKLYSWDGLPRRRGDDTLTGWASRDAVIGEPGTVISRPFDVPPSTEISEAIIESFDLATFGSDAQAQRYVNVYWTYRGKRFAARLFYVVGDAKGPLYEGILKQTIFSFRPLHPASLGREPRDLPADLADERRF